MVLSKWDVKNAHENQDLQLPRRGGYRCLWRKVESSNTLVVATAHLALRRTPAADSWNYRKNADAAVARVGRGWNCGTPGLSNRPSQGRIFAYQVWKVAQARAEGNLRLGRQSHGTDRCCGNDTSSGWGKGPCAGVNAIRALGASLGSSQNLPQIVR